MVYGKGERKGQWFEISNAKGFLFLPWTILEDLLPLLVPSPISHPPTPKSTTGLPQSSNCGQEDGVWALAVKARLDTNHKHAMLST